MRRPLPAFVLCLALGSQPGGAAAEPVPVDAPPGDDEPLEVEAAPIDIVADEPPEPIDIQVRGRRRARSASEVRRDRRVLEAAPHATGSDLLRTVPGVFLTQHSGEGKAHQIFFRGFDAVHGQDVELFVAGAPVNEVSNVHGQGYADLHFVMPEVVEEVIAQPGSFAPEQGDFAIAGTMRMRLGLAEPGVMLRTTYGSFDTARAFAAYRPEGQPSGTFVAGEIYRTSGFGVARAAERASTVGQVIVPLDRGIALRLQTSGYYGRYDAPGVLVQRDIARGRISRFGSYDPEQGGRSLRSQAVAELVVDRDDWRGRFAPYLVHRHLQLRLNFTGAVDDPQFGDNRRQRNDATTVGARASLERRFSLLSHTDTLGGGVSVRHDIVDQRHLDTRGPPDELVHAGILATHAAGWLEATTRLVPRTIVRGGLRVDGIVLAVDDRLAGAERASSGVVASPRTSVDVALLPGLHALGGYGMGLRSPQARSLADGEQTPFTRSHAFELGLRAQHREAGRILSASLAGYGSLLDEDLVFNEATSRNEASPGTLRIGGALDIDYRLGDLFLATVGASYTRATFREGDRRFDTGDLVPFVPQVVLRSDTALTPTLWTLDGHPVVGRAGLGLSGLFRRPLPFGEVGEDVFLVDLRLGARWRWLEAGLDVTNLLDAGWYDGQFLYRSTFGLEPTAVPRRHVTVGAPRRFLGTLTVRI